MSFVDITGTVDADTDGIVFEGKPGLERPIIPRFVVPTSLARALSKLTMGDAEEIGKQRRAGNANIEFDENKLRKLISDIGGNASQIKPISQSNAVPSSRSVRESIPLQNIIPENGDSGAQGYKKVREALNAKVS